MRTFVALPLPADFKVSLEENLTTLRRNHRDLRWMSEENLHITLAFLGEIDSGGISLLIDVVHDAAEQTESIPVSAGALFTLPQQKNANTLALGFAEGNSAIAALSKKIEGGLEKITSEGVYEFRPREKRLFTAHLTIARKGSGPMKLSKEGLKMSFHPDPNPAGIIDKIVVFKSELHREGAFYTPLAEFALGGFYPSSLQ
jgi:2'-5' RNA ligase